MKRAKGKLQSPWPIGLTTITIVTENQGLQPYWREVENALLQLAYRNKEDPRKLRDQLNEVIKFVDGR